MNLQRWIRRWSRDPAWPADPHIERTMRQELAAIADRRSWESTVAAAVDRPDARQADGTARAA